MVSIKYLRKGVIVIKVGVVNLKEHYLLRKGDSSWPQVEDNRLVNTLIPELRPSVAWSGAPV